MSYLGARLKVRPRGCGRRFTSAGVESNSIHCTRSMSPPGSAPGRICTSARLLTSFTGLVWRIDSCRFFNARGQAFARGNLPYHCASGRGGAVLKILVVKERIYKAVRNCSIKLSGFRSLLSIGKPIFLCALVERTNWPRMACVCKANRRRFTDTFRFLSGI